MVDEFQDTNIIQYELIKLLTSDTQNIFIVGDQDQSIYSFRGAKVENIDLFIKDFPLCKQILLEENYRSTNPILKIANNVIDCNKHRIKRIFILITIVVSFLFTFIHHQAMMKQCL